mmetsp:Transcript_845/g.1124  ORF Transcript_845/g.1124 Transcript_845/m.1124 type:complete len:224 (-) Transcript_845:198-869(-)
MGPSEAALTAAQISAYLAPFSSTTVRSTTDTSAVGTRKAMPVSLPFRVGITFPTALAAPVEEGITFMPTAPRPPRQSFREGPSTVGWVAVAACTVVIKPSLMPKLSLITLARGARQLVVQEALETILMSFLYSLWFTPITNMGVWSPEGAEITTFFAPPTKCLEAPGSVRNFPVDSTTYSAPASPQLILVGSSSLETVTALPSMTNLPFSTTTLPGYLPCTVS